MPPGRRLPPGGERIRASASQPWAPWGSLGAGLLLAGGVAAVVFNVRRRRQRQAGETDLDGTPPDA
ncbi:MAG: hypothetical protein ACK59A_02485 [Cyanobacteriota bacterium]